MIVGRERGAVVHHVQAGSACRLSRAETGAPLSRPARASKTGPSPLGVSTPPAERRVVPGVTARRDGQPVPLPDWPAGQPLCAVVIGGSSAGKHRRAATVTQAGGVECALPAFFAQAPAGKRAGTEEPASGEALRVSETLGGVLGPVGGF